MMTINMVHRVKILIFLVISSINEDFDFFCFKLHFLEISALGTVNNDDLPPFALLVRSRVDCKDHFPTV